MGTAYVRPREALGRTETVRGLTENREIAFAVGLECDTTSVRLPNRETVSSAKRQTSNGFPADQLGDPNDRLAALHRPEYDPRAVR